MAIDFLDGLASTVEDVLTPFYRLAYKIQQFFFSSDIKQHEDSIEPFR
jgi:hypothetical protein